MGLEVDAMKPSFVVFGMIAGLTVGGAQAGLSDTELAQRVTKLEERVALLDRNTKKLEVALSQSDVAVAALSKQVKAITEAQERFARAVSVDPSGAVRITGNLRLDNNTIDDITIVGCDKEATSKRQCTCPQGMVTVGIELRPLAVSAYPGPSTYNTALVCGRL
jgi:uncharacterized coiled-coil protein SlyX